MTTTRHNEPARRAAIYARISKDEEGDELGVKRQEKLCRELAARLGWTVAEVYADDNLSAFKRNKHRPGYERLIADIKAGRVDAVLAYNPDRLCRDDLRGLEDLIGVLNEFEVAVSTVRSGEFDLSTAHGRAQARMAGVWARLESEKMSERLTDKHAEIAGNGMPNGGRRPLGYHRDGMTPATPDSFPCKHHNSATCTARPGEAAIAREMIERIAAGETLTRVADDLNARRVLTAGGAPWSISTVRRVVLNGRYAGRREHKGVDVGEAAWPAIVDEATWRRAKALLNSPDRARRRSARRYLLTGGVIECGKCGKPMRSKPNHVRGQSRPTYICQPRKLGGCGGVSINADAVEQLVAARVIALVESREYAAELRGRRSGDRQAAAEVSRVEADLAAYATAASTGAIRPDEYLKIRSGLQARLEHAQTEMAGDTSAAATARFAGRRGALREWWEADETTLDQRQAVLRSVVARVVIAPVGRGSVKGATESRVTVERAS